MQVLASFPKMQLIFLELQDVSGSFPDAIADMTDLVSLNLNENELTGVLPSRMSQLTKLLEFKIAGNRLTGPWIDISNMTNLAVLEMSRNDFTGSLSAWPEAPALNRVHLCCTRISGKIPPFPSSLRTLRFVDLSDSQYTGHLPPIPASTSWFSVKNNLLTGPLPLIHQRVVAFYAGNNKFRCAAYLIYLPTNLLSLACHRSACSIQLSFVCVFVLSLVRLCVIFKHPSISSYSSVSIPLTIC
jgi:hypothetical protein